MRQAITKAIIFLSSATVGHITPTNYATLCQTHLTRKMIFTAAKLWKKRRQSLPSYVWRRAARPPTYTPCINNVLTTKKIKRYGNNHHHSFSRLHHRYLCRPQLEQVHHRVKHCTYQTIRTPRVIYDRCTTGGTWPGSNL